MTIKRICCFTVLFALLFVPFGASARDRLQVEPLRFEIGDWGFDVNGFLRAGYEHLIPSTDYEALRKKPLYGFKLYNARLSLDIWYANFVLARTSFDVAGSIDLAGKTEANIDPKDMYIELAFFDALKLRIGQYKVPFDTESLQSETNYYFISNSVVSSGYYDREQGTKRANGFAPGRKVGISILSDLINFDVVGLEYHVAFTQADAITRVDKIKPNFALFARFELHLLNTLFDADVSGSFMSFTAAMRYQRMLYQSSEHSDLEEYPALAFDFGVALNIHSFYARVAALYERIELRGDFVDEKIGTVLLLSYRLPIPHYRFEFGYRFALLFPENDYIMENTGSLAYFLEDFPLSFRIDYSHNHLGTTATTPLPGQEDALYAIHQIQFLTQVVW